MKDLSSIGFKVVAKVEKYHDGNTDREPDEIVERVVYLDGEGNLITDPARIAEIDANAH